MCSSHLFSWASTRMLPPLSRGKAFMVFLNVEQYMPVQKNERTASPTVCMCPVDAQVIFSSHGHWHASCLSCLAEGSYSTCKNGCLYKTRRGQPLPLFVCAPWLRSYLLLLMRWDTQVASPVSREDIPQFGKADACAKKGEEGVPFPLFGRAAWMWSFHNCLMGIYTKFASPVS